MIRTAILAALALVCVASNAEARNYRSHVIIAHERCNVDWPCEGVSASPRGEMIVKAMRGFGVAQKIYHPQASHHVIPQRKVVKRHVTRSESVGRRVTAPQSQVTNFASSIAKPSRYIAGRLICAVNVGAALAERGIKGTGSALAMSYLHWGRSAGGPVPGAVIVSSRRGGGHVAIVSRVSNGVVYAWNATGGQSGWREIPYRLHVIDYRVPG